ncbi:M13 family metallopeptidase [Nocardioides lianchengensis]|uniref:Endothelin-converting enzyme/putative endopeptidase n=1 Tax=Nocardioides lianchengensis TaxID=1045774 RepID=A0A1G6LZM7_9ACTN|nr:M13-type metalloendopeptidase [Nocardioides lianchengensis]NYG12397.1 endothelin-converting enzyme/putative endopeptidase [Nocardioides lianchengensis]SDC48679.1 endothelin-converting enzyme/putative endopeptidase [Nocardioides lianchengensis]
MTILDDAREGMNPDIRPQDDLFGHVNGRWLDETEIPSDRSSWGPFVQLADGAESDVKAIIEDLAAGDAAAMTDDARKIGDLFASFMDTDAINAKGLRPVRPLIDAVDALRDVRDLAAFLGEFERIGGHGLFGSYVDSDDRNSERYLFHLVQGGLGLPDESYYREEKFAEVREKYVGYLTRLLTLAEHPDAAGAAATVLAIDTKLAAGHWERADTRDVQKTYNLLTADELKALCPSFDWDAYVTNLGGNELTVAESCVRQPSYFGHLSTVLDEVPIADWKAWLLTHVLRSAAPYLTDDFVEANFDFYGRTLNGTPELRARWKRGVALVEGALGEAVGQEYVARHFPPTSKALMDDLVANLLAAYRVSIEALDWMTDETKQRAYAKLETFRPKIGYPEKFRDYSGLQVSANDLLGNVAAASSFETDRQLGKLGNPVDRDEWFMLPQTVNAYYNPGTNEICFPAGILQKPFFSPDALPAENYGGIGAVIGHEIGHGFDDQGAQYDPHGNLEDWWTADDKAAFEVKTKKLVEQYDGFEPRNLPGEKVNGSLTVGENIGDLGGLTIAHKAYLISQGGEASVEDRRRLFSNWAYVWRTKRRTEQEQQYLTIDPHSPPEFRANIVRNLDEFHDAFETAPGDGLWLEPDDRVRIW